MISFMFAVLGSVMFWVLYAVVGLFATVLMVKAIAPKVSDWIKDGCPSDDNNAPEYTMLLILNYIFWPIIGTAVIVCYVVKYTFVFTFRKSIIAIFNSIPEITIKKK